MEEINFCPSCGKNQYINAKQVFCDCGTVLNSHELRTSQRGLMEFDEEEFLPAAYREDVDYLLGDGLKLFKLDGLYFRASSAKKDLFNKVECIKNSLIPSLTEWKEVLEICENEIIEHKSTIAFKIFNITNLILKEYYGPFKVNPIIQEFQSYRDFSMFNIKLNFDENNLDFDIENQLALSNVIGSSLDQSVDAFFSSSVFEKAQRSNRELTEGDLKVAGIGAGISLLGNMATGIGDIMGQNSDNIEKIREADKNLNYEIDKIRRNTQSLAIHENEILKRKRVLITEEQVLDYCNNVSLNPVFEKFFEESEYIRYKSGRHDLDVGVLKTKFEEDVLNEKIKVSFWSIFFRSKRKLFKKSWKERLKTMEDITSYRRYNEILSKKEPTILDDIYTFKKDNNQKFKEYEKKHRVILEQLPSYSEAKNKVNAFTLVLKRIKNNLEN